MKYCGQATCHKQAGYMDCEGDYCRDCGTELTPFIACGCGKASFHPHFLDKFCAQCGQELTPAYLSQCMSQQLKGMLSQVKSVEPHAV